MQTSHSRVTPRTPRLPGSTDCAVQGRCWIGFVARRDAADDSRRQPAGRLAGWRACWPRQARSVSSAASSARTPRPPRGRPATRRPGAGHEGRAMRDARRRRARNSVPGSPRGQCPRGLPGCGWRRPPAGRPWSAEPPRFVDRSGEWIRSRRAAIFLGLSRHRPRPIMSRNEGTPSARGLSGKFLQDLEWRRQELACGGQEPGPCPSGRQRRSRGGT